MRDPDTLEEISKERFEGTVLKATSRVTRVKKEEAPEDGPTPPTQVGQEIPSCPQKKGHLCLSPSDQN